MTFIKMATMCSNRSIFMKMDVQWNKMSSNDYSQKNITLVRSSVDEVPQTVISQRSQEVELS